MSIYSCPSPALGGLKMQHFLQVIRPETGHQPPQRRRSISNNFSSVHPIMRFTKPALAMAGFAMSQLASAAPAPEPGNSTAALEARQIMSGDVTHYTPNGLGACGVNLDPNAVVVALSAGRWEDGNHCGRWLRVLYNGRQVDVWVGDRCPQCGFDDLDIGIAAFGALTDPGVGRIRANWHWVT